MPAADLQRPKSAIADIITATATAVLALGTIALVAIALWGLSDPLLHAISGHILAGTVKDLQAEKQGLEAQRFELQNSNTALAKQIEADRATKSSLEGEIQQTRNEIAALNAESQRQQKSLNNLNKQIEALKSQREASLRSLELVNHNLANARQEVDRQLRNILIYQAALLAAQIYDARLYDQMYHDLPPNMIIVRPKPILSGGGRCFETFSAKDNFNWWHLMECQGENENFPWPGDKEEKRRVENDLNKLKTECRRLTAEFKIVPAAPGTPESTTGEIVEFQSFAKFLENPVLRDYFCSPKEKK